MLVVSVPVHRADGTGRSAAGILVLGRFLDGGLIERLGRQVHARFTLDPVGRRQSPVKVQEPVAEIATDETITMARMDGSAPASLWRAASCGFRAY